MSKTDKRYERRILAAKHKARSELGDVEANWYASGYAQKMDLSLNSFNDRCPRIDYQLVSTAEFRSKFEAQYKPVVIQNSQLDWISNKKWSLNVCPNFFEVLYSD